MLGSPILYLKAMRILMFQLSGFYCRQEVPSTSRFPSWPSKRRSWRRAQSAVAEPHNCIELRKIGGGGGRRLRN